MIKIFVLFAALGTCLDIHSQEIKVIKGDKVKIGGIAGNAYVFEYGSYTFVTDASTDMDDRFNFAIVKYDVQLKEVSRFYFKFEKSESYARYALINLRLNTKGYLTFCYGITEGENSKVYLQKVNLNELSFEGKAKVILNCNGKTPDYDRILYGYISPSEKYMLLRVDIGNIHKQILFDEDNQKLYENTTDLDKYIWMLDNSGRMIAYREKHPEQDDPASRKAISFTESFDIFMIDEHGVEKEITFTPDEKAYTLNIIDYWGVVVDSYMFKVVNDYLYYVSFVTCDDSDDSKVLGSKRFSNGIYYSVWDIKHGFTFVIDTVFEFNKAISESLVDRIFSTNRKKHESLKQGFNEVKKCDKYDVPMIFLEDFLIDDIGNLFVFGSSYAKTNSNLYDPDYTATGIQFLYSQRNVQMFQINENLELNNQVGLFVRRWWNSGYFFDSPFLIKVKDSENTCWNFYWQYQAEMKPGVFLTMETTFNTVFNMNKYGYFRRTTNEKYFYLQIEGNSGFTIFRILIN